MTIALLVTIGRMVPVIDVGAIDAERILGSKAVG